MEDFVDNMETITACRQAKIIPRERKFKTSQSIFPTPYLYHELNMIIHTSYIHIDHHFVRKRICATDFLDTAYISRDN